MPCYSTPASALTNRHWDIIGVGLGILIAEILSTVLDPTVAWYLGGSVIGIIPAACRARGRTAGARLWTAPLMGLAVALTHLGIDQFA